jgi:hypothetical protein
VFRDMAEARPHPCLPHGRTTCPKHIARHKTCPTCKENRNKNGLESAYLENLLRIRPAGVTSKNDIGDRKMAVAILSCNFRDAYAHNALESILHLYAPSHTSMEQKIHRISVWVAVSAADPTPNKK